MPASYWLVLSDDPTNSALAKSAFDAMGTNALPFLERTLRMEDPPTRTFFVKWLARQQWLKSKLGLVPPAWTKHSLALRAISWLGPAGQPALPDIVPLTTNQNPVVMITACHAFKAIGPDGQTAKPYVPTLLYALGNKNLMGRFALEALAAIRPMPSEVAPALSRLIQNSRERDIGPLLYYVGYSKSLTNVNFLPMVDQLLHESNSSVVSLAASRIGDFGAAASGSVPRLQELCDDPSQSIRKAATNALVKIITDQPLLSSPRF
jgi:hypothetical protein